MHQRQLRRVQRLPRERDRPAPSVRRIADQRMADRRQVHADLVRASGLQPAAQQRRVAEALDHLVVGARGLARGHDRHRGAARRMATDRRVDGAAAGDVAARERQVLAAHAARLQLADEAGLRRERPGHDQESAGLLVQPMDDAGARHAGEGGRVVQQRVQQRSVPVAAARMDDEARRLVDDDQRLVLVHDRQRDRLRRVRTVARVRRRQHDHRFAAAGLARRIGRDAVDVHAAGVDPGAQPGPREFGQRLRQRRVEAQARGGRRQRQRARRARGFGRRGGCAGGGTTAEGGVVEASWRTGAGGAVAGGGAAAGRRL